MQITDRFYVLDYDRCLGNAERLYALLQESAAAVFEAFDAAAMDAERDATEADGQSFDELAYIQQHLADDARYRAVFQTFIARGQALPPGALLEAGAVDFLHTLTQRAPYGILTFGSQAWQSAKLEACSLDGVPHIVMDHKHKIRRMKEWRDAQTGLFALPPEFRDPTGYSYARELILIDDKASAFADIETDMRGYWLLHRQPLPSQTGEVDTALVSRVASFAQVLDHEADIDKA